ncbi:MAG: hypothetical protein ACOY3K_05150 [Candidatus Omnitrophota bacterium]
MQSFPHERAVIIPVTFARFRDRRCDNDVGHLLFAQKRFDPRGMESPENKGRDPLFPLRAESGDRAFEDLVPAMGNLVKTDCFPHCQFPAF